MYPNNVLSAWQLALMAVVAMVTLSSMARRRLRRRQGARRAQPGGGCLTR